MKRKISLVYYTCPRCGKQTVGLNRSITGTEVARNKYKGLCEKCATEEEKMDILKEQAEGILKGK